MVSRWRRKPQLPHLEISPHTSDASRPGTSHLKPFADARHICDDVMLKAWLRLRLQPLHAGQKYRLQSKRLYSEESSTGTTTFSPDGHSTLRRRQYDNKPLPLPPLLDPIALEAKERHTRPKAARDELEKTAFQRKLELNAHGVYIRLLDVTSKYRQTDTADSSSPSNNHPPMRLHPSTTPLSLPHPIPCTPHRIRQRRSRHDRTQGRSCRAYTGATQQQTRR